MNVKNLFENYFKPFVLHDYKCIGCGARGSTEQTIVLGRLANYMIIAVNRVLYNSSDQAFKCQAKLNYPLSFLHDD